MRRRRHCRQHVTPSMCHQLKGVICSPPTVKSQPPQRPQLPPQPPPHQPPHPPPPPPAQPRAQGPPRTLPADEPPQRRAIGHFRTIANTYIPDMYDPAAVEVLLVVLEICHILDLTPTVVEQIFGVRVLVALETWGDLVPPRRRPGLVRRAWVWLPNQSRPGLYPIGADGTIRVHDA